MKKFYLGILGFLLVSVAVYVGATALAQSERWNGDDDKKAESAFAPSPNLMISQFQPGTSNANDEWVEIHNSGSAPVDLNGYRVVYRSANGSADVGPFAAWTTSTILQPGQYYLIASTSYAGSVTPNITYNPSVCACSMSATSGGVAIRQGAMDTGAVIDSVGWGSATNIFVETTPTTAPGNTSGNSKARKQNGCQDTDNNANDFELQSPFAPRNTSTSAFVCSGSGTNLFAAMNGNPTTAPPGGSTLLTVTVIPATTPPSSGISVTGNLSAIGGSPIQPFYDNGTNGDVTAGDNVFSFAATIPPGTSGGSYVVTSVAQDAQGRSVNLTLTLTVNAPLPGEDPLLLGNPTYATPDVSNENNYLMPKPQYTLSYNRSKAIPNWVAWRLDTSWLGPIDRQDDFRPDPALPEGWYRVQDGDYSNSGFSRGHMTPSGDRTRSIPDNSATFLMTNMIPQAINNNSGPWQNLEDYCRTLAQAGNELYIISGGQGTHPTTPTISQGRISVPAVTWKVVLVLPNGADDLRRVNRSTRVFGVIMPNLDSVVPSSPWRNYRVTVDAVESLTGFNFFSEVPRNIQEYIESRRDTL
jgi:DNA/RNA endonuclease G (NUC1)